MQERLQKILSARGICSRRKAEEYILQGLVRVNGKVATIGQKADPEVDAIEVDGKVIEARKEMVYYVMHKPVGVVTSNVGKSKSHKVERSQSRGKGDSGAGGLCDSVTSSTVRDLLPPELRGTIYPVGRLDKDSSGLLLFTNDGVLAYRLTHPKFDHEKEYEVETFDPVTDGQILKLERGVTLSGEKTKPARIARLGPSKFRIALTEGRNRQIRRMCQKVGCPIKTLERIRIMTLRDVRLKPGMVRPLSTQEKTALLRAIGL